MVVVASCCGMFFSGRDWETSQDGGKMSRAKSREILDENLLQSSSPSNRTMTLSTQPRQRGSGFRTNLLEWPSQSPDLNLIEHLWKDLKIAVQRHSPSNLTELEGICREEWAKLPKYRCAKLVASYPRRLEAVIAAKGTSTK
uniref:Tc1-like transposase DDE domain-containing protein n=1 Tax=Oncorhynchus tshawytscha TaxID=74940 RepID=A0AAZ3NS11_ONCTS